jgi:DNA-directed RNA polymerase specialized sigma24 family protein
MIPSSEEKSTIANIVIEQCNAQAPRWNACGNEAFAAVFVKLCENLESIEHLEKPLEHYARRTANPEARRFFNTEKHAVLSCVPSATFEDFAANRDCSVLESLEKAQTHERLFKALSELPSDQREALLVRAGAQALNTEGADLPNSIRGLARRRGCSPQHLCNLADRAERWLQKQLL